MESPYIINEHSCCLFRGRSLLSSDTRNVVPHLYQSVNYHQNGIVSLAFRQSSHEVHSDIFPEMTWYGQWLQLSIISVSRGFCSSTGVTVLDASCNQCLHFWPVVTPLDRGQRAINSWMSHGWLFMNRLDESLSNIIFSRNVQSIMTV